MDIRGCIKWSCGLSRPIAGCLLAVIVLLTACNKDNGEMEEASECIAVAATGHISAASPSGPYTFSTNGGGTIVVDPDASVSIMHDDYPGFKIELWGDTIVDGRTKTAANHENLNGKHIMDRNGSRRTIIFPDGAKITMVASGTYGPLQSVSIYDDGESHRIDPTCNTLVHSATAQGIPHQLDNEEADGLTAAFEFTATGLAYVNLYTESEAGNKVEDRYLLGEIFRDNPNQVKDYYDDPNLDAT